MIWDNFSILEQIAPSAAAHARTLLRGFSQMSRRGKTAFAFEIPEIVYALGPQLKAFMEVGIFSHVFRRKLL